MRMSGWLAALVLAVGLTGCNSQEAQNAADNAGDKLAKSTEQAGKAASNALVTGKIRTAIETAADVKIEGLNVDTIDTTVTLKGKALDAKSRSTAETIAKTQAGSEFSVKNELTVGS